MARWQRRARLLIAVGAVGFAIAVALAFRGRPAAPAPAVALADPKAVVETAGSMTVRVNRDKEEVRLHTDQRLGYADGSSKLLGVRIVTERAGGRTFTLTGRQGEAGPNEREIVITGDVHLVASDGLDVRTDRATYSEHDGMVRAAGPVDFARGRMRGSAVGATYDKNSDLLVLAQAVAVVVTPDAGGQPGMTIRSGSATVVRGQRLIRFEGGMTADRETRTMRANLGLAYLSEDEQRVERLELRGDAAIGGSADGPGSLEALTGRDIDLFYAPDGQTLQRTVVMGAADIRLAGERQDRGRRISAETVQIDMAPDGATPVALAARERVEMVLPAAPGESRAVRSQRFDGSGEPGRGLTAGRFGGDVRYQERSRGRIRDARSGTLEVTMAADGGIEEARFARGVRFVDDDITATAALARYVLATGVLELTGSERGAERPRVVDPEIHVEARRIEVTLPATSDAAAVALEASGAVKSELQPARSDRTGDGPGGPETRLPGMLKDDQVVIVTSGDLAYDGGARTATYAGDAWLLQGDTSLKGGTIVIDEGRGDLSATGPVVSTSMLSRKGADGTIERTASTARASGFRYEDAARRATYTGDAHVSGAQGELEADRIELYFEEGGETLERLEAYQAVTLADQGRKTTGARLTYHAATERYIVTGSPVTVRDECGRQTEGLTVTFERSSDQIVVDGVVGHDQMRTRTTGRATCK